LDKCEKTSIILGVGEAVEDPRFIPIMRWDDAWRKLGITFKGGIHEKYELLSKKASELEQPIYILGDELDVLIGDSRWKMSWIDRPLNETGFNTLIAVALALISRGVGSFNALTASGYLAGIASRSGYEAVEQEIKRLSSGDR